MRKLIISVTLILTVGALTDIKEWSTFKAQHGKSYRDLREEKLRYAIFKLNVQKINNHNEKYNKGESSFEMGINQFADMTTQEFQRMLGYKKNKRPNDEESTFHVVDERQAIPSFINWTKLGAVTRVKNQGDCGSCWSFSAIGTFEGQYFRKTGKLISFSAQNLVDCDRVCDGCGGGYMDYALKYIQEKGVMTEKDYPYSGWNQDCHVNKSSNVVKINSFVYVRESYESELMHAVATVGPISIGIQATDVFQFYKSGIMNDTTCRNTKNELNHGVLAVGYGTQNGIDYWIVKNSWGERWGERGFIRMLRNAKNQCGIATEPLYPVM